MHDENRNVQFIHTGVVWSKVKVSLLHVMNKQKRRAGVVVFFFNSAIDGDG